MDRTGRNLPGDTGCFAPLTAGCLATSMMRKKNATPRACLSCQESLLRDGLWKPHSSRSWTLAASAIFPFALSSRLVLAYGRLGECAGVVTGWDMANFWESCWDSAGLGCGESKTACRICKHNWPGESGAVVARWKAHCVWQL